jgi:hypothetical protein
VLYQYYEGIYYERDYKRNITISITILFVRGEREVFFKQTRVVKEKRDFYLKNMDLSEKSIPFIP